MPDPLRTEDTVHRDVSARRLTVAVVHLGSNGGGPKFTFELTRALQGAGVRTLAVIARGADNRKDFESIGSTLTLPTFSTRSGALLRSPLILSNVLRLRRQLRRGRVDAVVVGMEQIWQAPILLLSRGRHRPQLLCVHDAVMHPGEHNRVEHLLRLVQRRIADGALAFSSHVAAGLKDTSTFAPDRIWRTVHAAYGVAAVLPHSPAEPGRIPTIGFFGRLSEYKGLDLCYDAIGQLRATGRRLRFSVVGNGPDELVAGMSHPDDDVRVGWVDDAEIPDVLRGFTVLALPYIEASQSGVFAYAMSQGLPMVVTPVGGLLEQAQETLAAAIADEVSAAAFARATARVLDDPETYRELAASALEAAGRDHSWSRVGGDTRAAVMALIDREVA